MSHPIHLFDLGVSPLPGHGRRTFDVPDPPELPPIYDNQGNFIQTHWASRCNDHTAKLNDGGTGFDVRHINLEDDTGEGKRFPGDWPIHYRLGPPSQMPDWNPLLEKYGFQVLEAAGFINHVGDAPEAGIFGRLAHAEWRNPTFDSNLDIHPLLRQDMFKVTPEEYTLLTPALLIASAVLDDPATLNYFHALMDFDAMGVVFDPTLQAHCRVLTIPEVLSEDQYRAVYEKLCGMRLYTSFTVDYAMKELWFGFTEELWDPVGIWYPATSFYTRQSKISLTGTYMMALEMYARARNPSDLDDLSYISETLTMLGVPEDRRTTFIGASAMLRTSLMLAVTILHELAHAVNMAYYQKPEYGPHLPGEPWVAGNRSNEQGSSFEEYAFGASLKPIIVNVPPLSTLWALLQMAAAPFGFMTVKGWDQWTFNAPDTAFKIMESVRPEGLDQPQRMYPVPQEWTEYMFTTEAWLEHVWRYGLDAIKVPEKDKWMISLSYGNGPKGTWTTGVDRWNTGPPSPITWA